MSFLQDLFERGALNDPLGGTTPDVGSNWDNTGEAGLFKLGGDGSVRPYDQYDSGAGVIANPTAIPDTAGYTIELLGRFTSLAAAQNQVGFVAQHNGASWGALGSDGYVGYNVVLSAADGLLFAKYNGASSHTPSAIPVSLVASTLFGLKLVKTDALLEVFVAPDVSAGYPETPTYTFTDNGTQGGAALGAGSVALFGRTPGVTDVAFIDALNAFTTSAGNAYSISGGTTVIVGVNAGMQYSQFDDVTVSGTLVSATGAALANVGNIGWAWYDAWGGAATDTGLMSTDGTGAFSVTLPGSALLAGQYGFLALRHDALGLFGLYNLPVA